MVVDQRTLRANMLRNNIGANVFNKLTGQQAQTPVQQPTNTPITQTRGTQGLQQQPETYKVITNKFPTYDIKDMMGAGSMKNQISFMQSVGNYNRLQAQADANTDPNVRYNLTKPELTNKQTLQIEQATPETNDQGLKINKTNSFKDLVADLQNVANQGRNLEFVKFRDLYPEYVENWDKVVDLFESIKSNPQYSAEQVTTTAQKAYPELFGIDDGYSNQDKTTALKKLYDEMVSNKQNGIQLTQQDIIDRYPEYANTEDINTVMEVQNLMNRDRKNTPTFNDIYENFESLIKGDTEIGNTEKSTMKKDIDKINNMSQSTYEHLSEEGKKYVQYLATAKEIADYVKEQYYTTASDVEIVESLKNNDPDLYNEIFGDLDIQANLSEEDRKLLDEGYTIGAGKSWWEQVKHSATEKLAGLGRQMQNRAGTEWKGEDEGGWHPQPVNGQREDGTYERNPLMREDGTLETNPVKIREIKMAGNNYQQRVRMQEYRGKNPGMDKIDYKIGEFLFGLGEEIQRAGEKATAKIESSQNWKDIMELNQTSFWDALKKGDVKTMLSKSTAALGQSTIDMGLGALTGDPLVTFGSMYAGSYERAMQDIESDENMQGLTREEKERAARLMAGVESVIEEASMSVMMPGVFGGEGALSKLLPGFNNALLKGIVQTELGAASEGGEEVLQEFFNNLITQSYGSDRELGDLQDYWNIFSETFLSSQLMSVIGGTKEGVQQAQINQIQNEIKKQGELRNTVLEGQALISEDFNDFAQRVEEVPGTTTEELQQVWNNAQQKKQDLENKANGITSNSYSNVATPTYERATVKDTVKPKITANESQQYTDLLDEMIKNKEISEEDRKRVEKTLGVFTLNNKSLEQQQGEKQLESQQPTGLSNLTDKTENNNTNNNRKIKAGVGTRMLQNYNRMNPKRVRKFEAQFGKTYGQWMEERGFTKAGESNVNDIMDYSKQMQKIKTDIIKKIAGDYRNIAVSDMLSYANERATDTLDRENIEWLQPLLDKYLAGKGLTFQEIEKMRKYFSNNINLPYYEDTDAKTAQKNMNIYTALQKYVEKIAAENGFDKLKEINAEISASEAIARGVIEKILGGDVNNTLGLTDWITIASAVSAGSPGAIATVLTKNALKNEKVRNAILKIAVGKRDNAKYRGVKVDLDNISKIADEKRRQQAIKEFNEKYGDLGIALPYKEGYNGTPTTTITVTPEGLSKTQGKVNTPNSEQKSQGLSETEKKSEPQDNVNEQVQDSIEGFLSDVGANETKQDLGNATTANYKNMSKRGLEQLLKSDKIPAEEAKKITDELAMRNVKEDKDGWDYLDHKYAYEIQQLQEEEQRIGKVGNKKVNKTYAEEQMKTWETKKEKLKEDMKQAYGDKDNDWVEDKYSELESKPIDYINEWTKSKRFAVDEAEQQVIKQLQENWNKINRFELNMTEEEKKVREDILGKVSDLYETKSTDYGDSFVSRTNRDNRGIIYRDDGRVNVNSLDTLKSSGLYDVLPDDTKIAISGQEQTTLGELKKQPKGLAEVSNTQAEQEVEGLAKINEKIAQEEQEKLDKENAEKQRLKDNVTRESIRDMDTKDAELDSERSIAEGQRAMLSEQEKAQQYFDSQEGLANITKKNTGNKYENLLNKYRAKIVDRLGLPKGTYLNKEIYDNLTPEQHKIVDEITEEYKAEYSKLQEESNRIREQEEARIESARQARNNEITNRAMRERQRLDMNGIKPAKSLPKGHKWTDEGSFTITTPGGTKLTILPIGNDLYIRNWSQIGTRGVNNTVIENYNRFAATELTNILNDDSVMGQENGDFGGIITEIWSKLGLPLGFTQSILRPLNGPRFQKGRGNPITKKQVNQLVKQLKKTGLAKDVKVYETQEEFEQAMDAENARLQSVWHGGGDFNRFDLNHVGEGEGNAAHGYGIYVTENKDRASEYGTLYRDNAYGIDTTFGRGTEQFVTYKGKKISEIDGENSSLIRKIVDGMQTKNEAYPYYDAESQIARIRRSINSEQNTWLGKLSANEFAAMKKRNQEKLDFLDSLDPNDFKVESTKRNLYDVEVPDTVKKDTPTGTNYLEEDGMITHEAYTEINDKLSEKIGDKLTRWSNKVTGKVLYERLTEKLGSMKAASEFLKDLGYDGIHYIGELDGSSYVIFDDKALQINDHIKYLKDTHGDIAGAVTPDGTVHLIESNLRGDTATHEFSHLLWSYAKKNNPNLYKALQKIAREAPQELKDYVKRTYGEMTDEAFLDEVFAWKQGKYSGIKTARTWYQRMWDAIKNIWNSIKNSFGSKYADLDVFEAYETMSSEELMDRVDKLLKGGKEIGQSNNADTRYDIQYRGIRDLTLNNVKKEGAYDPRAGITKVKGGWTKEKIRKEISKPTVGTQVGTRQALDAITEFDSAEDFIAHTFYHGTQGSFVLKPSMSIPEKTFERMADSFGGGYGQQYRAISLTTDKKIASNFGGASDHVNINPVILRKNAKVIEMPELSDSADLDDYIVDLWNDGVDAVRIGDKYSGEKELAVLNPRAIVDLKQSEYYRQYHLGWEDNPLNIKTDEDLVRIYNNAPKYIQELRNLGKEYENVKNDWYINNYGMTALSLMDDWNRYKEAKTKFEESPEYEEYQNKVREYNNYKSEVQKNIQFQKIGGLSNTQIKKFAVQQGLAEISKPQTKEYTVDKGKVKENF